LTINPSDLRNPLVLQLAGITYSADALPAATAAIRQATATSNPVVVAQFFHHTCNGVASSALILAALASLEGLLIISGSLRLMVAGCYTFTAWCDSLCRQRLQNRLSTRSSFLVGSRTLSFVFDIVLFFFYIILSS
jgi:hypothetical protein